MMTSYLWISVVAVAVVTEINLSHCIPIASHSTEKVTDRQILLKSIIERYPKLTFLGEINGKAYLLDDTRTDQAAGRSACQTMGMQLARFDDQSEITFIATKLPNSLNFWTDGNVFRNANAFKWESFGSAIPREVSITYTYDIGIQLTKSGRLRADTSTTGISYPSICYL